MSIFLRRVPRFVLNAAAAGLVLVLALTAFTLVGLPARSEVRALAREIPPETSVMRQRDGEAPDGGRRPRRLQKLVTLDNISKHLIHAVLSAEDPHFFGHEGLDWDAIRQSIETNLEKGGFARGGSTITQQLAKNVFFSTHKNLFRKAREAIVATWMERDLSKKRIIEIYLNVIEWGDGVYGCEAAAQRYYEVSCGALDALQAAGLAAMIPSPRRINPRANPRLHARATQRVLRLMGGAGYLKRNIADMGRDVEAIDPGDAGPEPPEEDERGTPTPQATPTPGPTPTAEARFRLSASSMIEFHS